MSLEVNIDKLLVWCAGLLVTIVLILGLVLHAPRPPGGSPGGNTILENSLTGNASQAAPLIEPDTTQASTEASIYTSRVLEDMAPANTALEINPMPLIEEEILEDSLPEPEALPEPEMQDQAELAELQNEEIEPGDSDLLITDAINSYVGSRQGELHREYVENCFRFRNRGGRQSECPDNELANISFIEEEREVASEIFANVRRAAEHAHWSRSLEMENKVLLGILDEDRFVSEAAQEQVNIRVALNKSYIVYLNGNASGEVAAHNTMFNFVNDFNRTIVPHPVQFNCAGLGPCIYKYTGFTAQRPTNYVQPEPVFEKLAPLFMPSKSISTQ